MISKGKPEELEEKPVPQTSYEAQGTEPRLRSERSHSLTAWTKERSPNFKANNNNNNNNNNCSWLRHYATSQKVAGSSPDDFIGFFFQFT
jgi:hypothetical protein